MRVGIDAAKVFRVPHNSLLKVELDPCGLKGTSQEALVVEDYPVPRAVPNHDTVAMVLRGETFVTQSMQTRRTRFAEELDVDDEIEDDDDEAAFSDKEEEEQSPRTTRPPSSPSSTSSTASSPRLLVSRDASPFSPSFGSPNSADMGSPWSNCHRFACENAPSSAAYDDQYGSSPLIQESGVAVATSVLGKVFAERGDDKEHQIAP